MCVVPDPAAVMLCVATLISNASSVSLITTHADFCDGFFRKICKRMQRLGSAFVFSLAERSCTQSLSSTVLTACSLVPFRALSETTLRDMAVGCCLPHLNISPAAAAVRNSWLDVVCPVLFIVTAVTKYWVRM